MNPIKFWFSMTIFWASVFSVYSPSFLTLSPPEIPKREPENLDSMINRGNYN